MRRPLNLHDFPSIQGTVTCKWATVLLSPIMDSPERLVIGVAVASETGFHLERANAFKRLKCLFGPSAETAAFAAQVALDELDLKLAKYGLSALQEGNLVFSGVALGPVRSGEGKSLASVARTWMGAVSSLYIKPVDRDDVGVSDAQSAKAADKLPILVLEDVKSKHPEYVDFFSDAIKSRRMRRTQVANVEIDFNSPKLVANFATLDHTAKATSVDRIKRKLFDLVALQHNEQLSFFQRKHEMIVYSPGMADPNLSERTREMLDEVHDELGHQSEREKIGFLPAYGVAEITKRITQEPLSPAIN